MQVFFRGGEREPGPAVQRRPLDPAGGPGPIPDDLLDRHGAVTLRPGEAVLGPKQPWPGSTVYRRDVLMIPENQLGQLDVINNALGSVGLVAEPPLPLERLVGFVPPEWSPLRSLPRPVKLRVREDSEEPRRIDAWAGTQTLWGRVDMTLIGVEHLMAGSAQVGVGGVRIAGTNWATEGSPAGGDSGARAGTGYATRIPVALMLPPTRPVTSGKRRPVVAVLDTGLGVNKWLGVARAPDGSLISDGYMTTDPWIQQAVRTSSYAEAAVIDPPTGLPVAPVDDFWDGPYVTQPLVGEMNTHAGHATFIAGIIRQAAPDCQVRAIRLMYPDGFAPERYVQLALHMLAHQAEAARRGDPDARPVDVISLSLGYFDENPAAHVLTGSLAAIVKKLSELGVAVVAAAGNYATDRPFYPAALAANATGPQAAPVISVGALNPNGTTALFSNDGPWVTCFATGASMVSTLPATPVGSGDPSNTVPAATDGSRYGAREALDPDDFTGGFGVWSGTSFAAPLVAGKVAQAMAAPALVGTAGPPAAPDPTDTAAVAARARRAVEELRGSQP